MATKYLGTGLSRVADVGLATGIAAQHLSATVGAIRTSGYSASGKGAGNYVNDSLATAGLAAAHPIFCKQSLDGRYWRLALDGGVMDVMQSGARGDGTTDDYAAIQAAIAYALTFNSATIRFPAGNYPVSAPLEIVRGKGLNLIGAGPDNTVIKAGAFAAMKTRGLWRSRFEGLGFWCNGNTTGAAFQLDGEPDGSFGTQGNIFTNCYFFGNYNSKYVFTVSLTAGGYGQGSENVWIGCSFAGTSNAANTALLLISGSNALQNTVIGCNFQSYVTGVKLNIGAVDILHCGFQSTYGYSQISNDGWDVDNSSAGLGDTVTMTGCRTESLRIFRGGGCPAQITAFAHNAAAVLNWQQGGWPLNSLVRGVTAAGNVKCYRVTTAGTSGASQPVWPESGTVTDGGIVWTQLDFPVFLNVQGRIANGIMGYGQIGTYGYNTHVEDVGVTRDDCFASDCFANDGRAPSFRNIYTQNPRRPIKLGTNANAGARNSDIRQINHGNQTLVWSRPIDSGTSGLFYDLAIAPAGGHQTNKVANFFGVTGGWGFAQVTFSELVTVSREGVTYFVTDGTPGSSPLTGGGTGCLAVFQNGAWRGLSVSSAAGGGVTDGDKGDITVSSSGASWTIDNGSVSLAKMADMATGSLFYRKTAGTGAPEVQTLATLKSDLGLNGTNSGDQTSIVGISGTKAQFDAAVSDGNILYAGDVTQYTDEMAQDAIGAMIDGSLSYVDGTPLLQRAALTGDVNAAAGSNLTSLANDAVTNAKLANVASGSIKGRASAGLGDPEDLTAAQATALLDTFSSSAKGLAPASGGGTANFLRADGTWAAPGGGGGGAPGGTNGELQFNNGGVFAGAANVEIDSGNLKLVSTTAPAAPSGGSVLFSQLIAGRHLQFAAAPAGIAQVLQGALHGAQVFFISATSSATAGIGVLGGFLTTTGTLSSQQTIASANPWQATYRRRYASAATAASTAGLRTANAQWFRGNAAGFGGFFCRTQFGQNLNVNGAQFFIGMCASTALLATTAGAVSALINMIGVGYDTTDASTGNWFLYRNDGTGTATKVDLGATHAARNTTHGYDLIIYCPPGAATEIFVRIVNLHTGAVVLDTSYTTDLPAVNTGLAFKAECNNGAVASAVNIEFAKVYIESDY